MRRRFFTGAAAVVGVLLLLTGCGALGRGGHKANSGPAPKPLDVLDAMRADVQAAVRSAMPGKHLVQPSYDRQNCAYSKWSDTSGSGRIVRSEMVAIDGDDSDARPVDAIIAVMVKTLRERGWRIVDPGRYGADDPTRELAKSGIAGSVRLAGSRIGTERARSYPTVNGTMFSDCLPDPDGRS